MTSLMHITRLTLTAILALIFAHSAFAEKSITANIRIQISGANTTHYLCIPGVGCLNIQNSNQGKVFRVLESVSVNRIFILDIKNGNLHSQAVADSCQKEVGMNETVTITGQLTPGKNQAATIQNLQCRITKG